MNKQMTKPRIDMTGWKMSEHGIPDSKLTVIEQAEDHIRKNGSHDVQWLCECSCEEHNKIIALGYNIRHGIILSCGCLRKGINKKYNAYAIRCDEDGNEFYVGYTSKGEEFWFDKDDFEIISKYCWFYNDYGYLLAYDSATRQHIRLHRLIMGVSSSKLDVDHKNHPPRNEHKIDNRKSNLEIVTRSQSNMNTSLSKNNTSGTTGISFDQKSSKWRAKITINYQRIELGKFENIDDAVKARKDAEIKYFGDRRYDVNNK